LKLILILLIRQIKHPPLYEPRVIGIQTAFAFDARLKTQSENRLYLMEKKAIFGLQKRSIYDVIFL